MVNEKPSSSIHTIEKTNSQPTSKQESNFEPQQNNFQKWLVAPKISEGGGVAKSGIFEISTLANTAKIYKNKTLENIQTFGFSNLRPDGCNPVKTDED